MFKSEAMWPFLAVVVGAASRALQVRSVKSADGP